MTNAEYKLEQKVKLYKKKEYLTFVKSVGHHAIEVTSWLWP